MAYEASQIPHRDVKAYLFQNLSDEENPQGSPSRYAAGLFGGEWSQGRKR